MWAKTISRIKLFCSHSITPSELRPGDHVYVWRNVKHLFMYQHHGVYIGDGKCIHFTTRQDDAAFLAQMTPTTTTTMTDKKNPEVIITNNTLEYDKAKNSYEVVKKVQDTLNTTEESPSFMQKIMKKLDPNTKANKAVIIETSLDYFTYGGKLKKARYSVGAIEYFCKAGGTCYQENRIDGAETVQKAMKYAQAYSMDKNTSNTVTNQPMLREVYSLSRNNCEHIVLEWTTGQRHSYQAYRLFRRVGLTLGLCGLSFYKVSENHILEATEKYAKLIVVYEHILNYWIYFATFIL